MKINKYWYIFGLLLPILFLGNLYINHFFSVSFKPLSYSFDVEKIVISNPNNLDQIGEYWENDVFIPYRIRNLVYGSWMVIRLWIFNVLKIVSPVYIIRAVGLAGLFLIARQRPKKFELVYVATIVASSAMGILIDTRMSLVLGLPIFIIWVFRSLSHLSEKNYGWLLVLLIIDVMLK